MKKADAVKEWIERRTAREWLMRFLYGMDVQAMQLQELDDWFEIYRAKEETEPVSEDASVLESIKPVKAEEDSAVQEESHHLSDKQMASMIFSFRNAILASKDRPPSPDV
jgi:hypothetical protein